MSPASITRNRHHRYLRAAKRAHVGDPEALLDVAAEELTSRQLASVVAVLVERHGYKLPKARRDALIDELLDTGMKPVTIAGLLGCHRRTVARRADRQVGAASRMNKRSECDKTPVRDPWPILTFSAAGGPDNVAAIRAVLATGRRA